MRSFLGVFVIALFANVAAVAEEAPTAADKAAIQRVIDRQLAAFMADDQVRAFSFASPVIQQLFVNPDNFMRMVRLGYPEVYRHSDASFDKLVYQEGEWVQLVWLTGMNGKRRLALYKMIRDDDGNWRINGCRLLETGQVGT